MFWCRHRRNETHVPKSLTIRHLLCRWHQFSHASHTRLTYLNVEAELTTLAEKSTTQPTDLKLNHQRSQWWWRSLVKCSHLPWWPQAYVVVTDWGGERMKRQASSASAGSKQTDHACLSRATLNATLTLWMLHLEMRGVKLLLCNDISACRGLWHVT